MGDNRWEEGVNVGEMLGLGGGNRTWTNGFGGYQWAFGVIIFHIHVGRMMCRGGGDRTGSDDLP